MPLPRHWMVGCFGFNGPLRQYLSLYRAVSQREGEKEEKGQMREKMSKQPPPAPTASATGPCPTIIQISRTPRHWKFIKHLRTTRPPHPALEVSHPGPSHHPTTHLNQRKEKRKYVARPSNEPRTPDLRVRCLTDCALRPGTFIRVLNIFLHTGWSGGAMVLGKLPVPGRSTYLDDSSWLVG